MWETTAMIKLICDGDKRQVLNERHHTYVSVSYCQEQFRVNEWVNEKINFNRIYGKRELKGSGVNPF